MPWNGGGWSECLKHIAANRTLALESILLYFLWARLFSSQFIFFGPTFVLRDDTLLGFRGMGDGRAFVVLGDGKMDTCLLVA